MVDGVDGVPPRRAGPRPPDGPGQRRRRHALAGPDAADPWRRCPVLRDRAIRGDVLVPASEEAGVVLAQHHRKAGGLDPRIDGRAEQVAVRAPLPGEGVVHQAPAAGVQRHVPQAPAQLAAVPQQLGRGQRLPGVSSQPPDRPGERPGGLVSERVGGQGRQDQVEVSRHQQDHQRQREGPAEAAPDPGGERGLQQVEGAWTKPGDLMEVAHGVPSLHGPCHHRGGPTTAPTRPGGPATTVRFPADQSENRTGAGRSAAGSKKCSAGPLRREECTTHRKDLHHGI